MQLVFEKNNKVSIREVKWGWSIPMLLLLLLFLEQLKWCCNN